VVIASGPAFTEEVVMPAHPVLPGLSIGRAFDRGDFAVRLAIGLGVGRRLLDSGSRALRLLGRNDNGGRHARAGGHP
jgi:hypothetical protein